MSQHLSLLTAHYYTVPFITTVPSSQLPNTLAKQCNTAQRVFLLELELLFYLQPEKLETKTLFISLAFLIICPKSFKVEVKVISVVHSLSTDLSVYAL